MTPTAVASTGTRPTQGLTVPTTQNTAPVLDFRCLYTYDLRRKQKRWQDGLLRFHTFNKRIMVYDVPRNYIGDKHWRGEGIVGDGDEFELDRGVLIQVGEATGSMEQDLTELLEKRTPRDVASGLGSSSPVEDTSNTTMASPAVVQPSLLKPKSLNALLGTPQGPIGRASLSKKSPHEMRETRNNVPCTDGRPTKRLRIAESSPIVSAPVISQPERSFPTRRNAISRGAEKENPARTYVSSGEDGSSKPKVPDPSSVGGQRSSTLAAPTAHETVLAVKPRAGNRIKSTRTQIGHEREETRPKVGTALPKSKEAQPRPATIMGRGSHAASLTSSKEKAAEFVEIISDVEVVSSSEPRKKKMKLQMASRKPRRKLMYRDLLPQDPPATSRSSSSTECTARWGHVTSIPSRSEPRSKEPLTEFNQGKSDKSKDRLNRRAGDEGARNASHKNKDPRRPSPPGLFLTQEDSDHHWTDRHSMTDDSASTCNIRSNEDASEEHPNPTPPAQAPKSQDQNIPKPPSTIHDTELTLTKMDEILFSRPQSKAPLPRKPKKPAAPTSPIRICSQSRIPSSPQAFPPSRPAPPAESIDSCSNIKTPPKPPQPTILPLKPPKSHPQLKLRQTISDPSNMHAAPPPQMPLPPSVASNKNKKKKEAASDQSGSSAWGPEAWDLFGCGRDGVECSYEEFKRKEGLI